MLTSLVNAAAPQVRRASRRTGQGLPPTRGVWSALSPARRSLLQSQGVLRACLAAAAVRLPEALNAAAQALQASCRRAAPRTTLTCHLPAQRPGALLLAGLQCMLSVRLSA